MRVAERNGHGSYGVRVLTLLAVLLGLLAMHGLATSHHAPAAAAERSAVGAPMDDAVSGAGHHGADDVAAAPQATRPQAAPTGPSCHGDCPSALVTLCLAVLATGSLVAAVVLLRRGRLCGTAVVAAATRAVAMPASARTAFAPPDPVRELCVSRT